MIPNKNKNYKFSEISKTDKFMCQVRNQYL